jgi:hypothetical protein
MRRNRRPCRSRHQVEKSYEYSQGNGASIVKPERPGGDSQGSGKEDGGCQKGLLCWFGMNLCFPLKRTGETRPGIATVIKQLLHQLVKAGGETQ